MSGAMKTLLMIDHHLSKPKRLALATQRQQASWTQGCVYNDEPGFWHLSFPMKNTWPRSWIPGEDEYEQQEKSYPSSSTQLNAGIYLLPADASLPNISKAIPVKPG